MKTNWEAKESMGTHSYHRKDGYTLLPFLPMPEDDEDLGYMLFNPEGEPISGGDGSITEDNVGIAMDAVDKAHPLGM